ncbi:MAG: hypothetical protein AB7O96_16840 [Pseudobdellovibrionaceae bacterium]
MTKNLIVLTISFLFFACGKPALLDNPKELDNELLTKASKDQCAPGHSFQQYTDEFKLGQQTLPVPVVFAIQKGGEDCALNHPINDAGTEQFLQVNFSGNCIKNNTFWTKFLYREDQMQRRTYIELKPLDSKISGYASINMATGRSISSLRNKIGLVMYHCVSSSE